MSTNILGSFVKPAVKAGLMIPISTMVGKFTGGPIVASGGKVLGYNMSSNMVLAGATFAGAYLWEWARNGIPRYTTGNTTTSFLEEEAYATLVLSASTVAGISLLKMGTGGINYKTLVVSSAADELAGEWVYGTFFSTWADSTPNYV